MTLCQRDGVSLAPVVEFFPSKMGDPFGPSNFPDKDTGMGYHSLTAWDHSDQRIKPVSPVLQVDFIPFEPPAQRIGHD